MSRNDCQTCGGSSWVPVLKKHKFRRYEGVFLSTEAETDLLAALPTHLRVSLPGKAQDGKFALDGPAATVEEEMDYAAPCPDCNKFARAAYEEGRLAYHLSHRDSPPNEEQLREANIAKAKREFGV